MKSFFFGKKSFEEFDNDLWDRKGWSNSMEEERKELNPFILYYYYNRKRQKARIENSHLNAYNGSADVIC